MLPLPSPLLTVAASTGGGGGVTVRGTGIMHVPNTIAVNFPLPAGSQVGDRMILFGADGYGSDSGTAGVSGWTLIESANGTNWNGAVWTGILSSTDITNGYKRYGFLNSFYGVVAGIVFVGATSGIRTNSQLRDGTGATSRTLSSGTTPSAPQVGDYAVAFGSARVNAACSCDILTQLQALNNTNACGVLNGAVLASAGAVSATFAYGAGATGDYQAIVIVQP